MKANCEGACDAHGEPLADVRVWGELKDWGSYTYCPEAIRRDREVGLTVFDVTACPRKPAACCNHPDADMCCGGGYDGPCDCECHAVTPVTVPGEQK
jgi:hypothetical protein